MTISLKLKFETGTFVKWRLFHHFFCMNQQVWTFSGCTPSQAVNYLVYGILLLIASFKCHRDPPTCCSVSCRPVRKGGQRVIPANSDSHTARVLTTGLNECVKKGPSSLCVCVYATANVWLRAWALRKAIQRDLMEGDSKSIVSMFVPFRPAVAHQPKDWSDWSISALICAQQPHLARSQGHTLRTSQNSQYWDSWQR